MTGMVPTRRFWGLLAAGIPLCALAAQLGSPLFAVAYNLVALIIAYVTFRLAPDTARLRFSRKHDQVLSVRAWNKVQLTFENEGDMPIQMRVRDEAPGSFEAQGQEFDLELEPGQLKTVTYDVRPPERGTEEFRGTWLRVACPGGLVLKQIELPTSDSVRVYPNVLALKEFDLLKQQGRLKEMGIRRSRARGLGSEFESLRAYGEGDDYRKIDWKASARRGDLMVRQFEQERNQAILICIDMGRHMLAEVNGVRKLDHVLDALLMLTNAAATAGDQVGVMVYADTVRRYIPPRKGRLRVGVIIDACHDIAAEPVESDPIAAFAYLAQRWKRRSLLFNFTDYEDEDRARELARAFGPIARRHLALLCRVTDPRMQEVLQEPLATMNDLYRRSAATMLLEDRRQATQIIESAGIRNLEAEPQELASKLVNYYFMVKEKSLL